MFHREPEFWLQFSIITRIINKLSMRSTEQLKQSGRQTYDEGANNWIFSGRLTVAIRCCERFCTRETDDQWFITPSVWHLASESTPARHSDAKIFLVEKEHRKCRIACGGYISILKLVDIYSIVCGVRFVLDAAWSRSVFHSVHIGCTIHNHLQRMAYALWSRIYEMNKVFSAHSLSRYSY